MAKQFFASNFKPVFKASELAKFCNIKTRSEKNEINFVLKYAPFSKFKSKIIKATNLKRKTLFNSSFEEKQKIKSELRNEFSSNETKIEFDDTKILNKIISSKSSSSSNENPTATDFTNVFDYIKETFQKDEHEKSLMFHIR